MSEELVIVAILCFMLLASNCFWAWINISLVNRLMSRNYFEFTQGKKNEASAKKPADQVPQVDEIDPYDQAKADQLNSLMGIV